ncbi:hypothetical protein [Bacillus sp. NTK074B]
MSQQVVTVSPEASVEEASALISSIRCAVYQ